MLHEYTHLWFVLMQDLYLHNRCQIHHHSTAILKYMCRNRSPSPNILLSILFLLLTNILTASRKHKHCPLLASMARFLAAPTDKIKWSNLEIKKKIYRFSSFLVISLKTSLSVLRLKFYMWIMENLIKALIQHLHCSPIFTLILFKFGL